MQPLMNMITFSARSHETIVGSYSKIADVLEHRDSPATDKHLSDLADHTNTFAQSITDEAYKLW